MNIDSRKVWNDNVNQNNDSKYNIGLCASPPTTSPSKSHNSHAYAFHEKLSSSTKRLSLLRNVLPRNLIATPTTIIVNHMVPKNKATACGCFRGLDIRSSCRSSVNSAITLDDEIKMMPHRRVSCLAIGENRHPHTQLVFPPRQPHRRSTLTASSRGIDSSARHTAAFYSSTPEKQPETEEIIPDLTQTLPNLLRSATWPRQQNSSSSPPRHPQRRSTISVTSCGISNLSLSRFALSSSPQRQRRQEQYDSPVMKQTLRILKAMSNQQEQTKKLQQQQQQKSPPR